MKNLKRYDMENVDWNCYKMVECCDGEYVKFDDLVAQKSKSNNNTKFSNFGAIKKRLEKRKKRL